MTSSSAPEHTQHTAPSVSVILVNFNGLADTRVAIRSLLAHSPGSEVIVVDNCSSDGSVEALKKEFAGAKIIARQTNDGFAVGCNRGADEAIGKYLFFLNNDTSMASDVPRSLAEFMEATPTAGICGPRILNPDGSFQLSAGFDQGLFSEWTMRRWQRRLREGDPELAEELERKFFDKNVEWVSGAALMIGAELFRRVGGFDESFFMYFEDADLCRRVRSLGRTVQCVHRVSLTHALGRSAMKENSRIQREYRKSQIHYYRKHASWMEVVFLELYLLLSGRLPH